MTDHKIIFSGEMILALLAGRKTQARREVTLGRTNFDGGPWPRKDIDLSGAWIDESFPSSPILNVSYHDTTHRLRPYWSIGGRLWVCESIDLGHGDTPICCATYKADGACVDLSRDGGEAASRHKNSVMHSTCMPRAYSRLTLHITDVRFQRLRDIGRDDAVAEGIMPAHGSDYEGYVDYFGGTPYRGPILSFKSLFTTINGSETWADNRWVIATTFEVERCNIAEARK